MQRLPEPTLSELLEEPIVRQLMASDGVSERKLRAIGIMARRRIERHRQELLAQTQSAYGAA